MKDLQETSKQSLLNIQKSISDIEKFVAKKTITSFCFDELTQDAVLMKFIVIGESILYVEQKILKKYDYPWYKVKSFRNMIAHDYFNIKMTAVWQIIINDLPKLKIVITEILLKEF